jgi:hypothetical protein
MAKNKFTYKSFVKEINSDMIKLEGVLLKEAATHLKLKIKKKLSVKGRSASGMPPGIDFGNLRKGIKFEIVKSPTGKRAFVGLASPAQHGHLLEFGTKERYTDDGRYTGRVTPRPFLVPTFMEETDAVKRILQGIDVLDKENI